MHFSNEKATGECIFLQKKNQIKTNKQTTSSWLLFYRKWRAAITKEILWWNHTILPLNIIRQMLQHFIDVSDCDISIHHSQILVQKSEGLKINARLSTIQILGENFTQYFQGTTNVFTDVRADDC